MSKLKTCPKEKHLCKKLNITVKLRSVSKRIENTVSYKHFFFFFQVLKGFFQVVIELFLALYETILTWEKPSKIFWRGNACNTNFISVPTFSTLRNTNFIFLKSFICSSAKFFNFDTTTILLFAKVKETGSR